MRALPKLTALDTAQGKKSYKSCYGDRNRLVTTPGMAVEALPGAPALHSPHSALGQGLSRLAPAQRGEQRLAGRNEQAFVGVKAFPFV